MAPVVTMRQLLEAGVHFGHQTRRWDPRMKRFIYGERNGIYIIDLQQTLQRIETAYSFVRDLVADGGDMLFIGTKKQAQDPVAEAAAGCGMPFINERWLGGMLTNFSTMSTRVKKMTEYQRMRAVGDFDAMPKKEALMKSRELEKLERNLGGIRDMAKLPDAVFIIDTKKEHIGVTEANKLKIPIVAVVDTNCNPDIIDFVIPGNDDAIRSGTLMCRIISDAVKEGRYIAERRGTAKPRPAALTAEQEADRARQQAEARNEAARQAAERGARLAAAAPTPAAAEQIIDEAVPEQSSPPAGQEPGGEPTPEVHAPPSDAVEVAPGSVPAGDNDADVAQRFPGAQPGSAETSPVGSHGGGASPAAEAGAVVTPPDRTEPEVTADVANVDGADAAEQGSDAVPPGQTDDAPGKTDTID
ncbi:MAG: 30S ribosomal protein S2 [Acidimicrobiales bacterium]